MVQDRLKKSIAGLILLAFMAIAALCIASSTEESNNDWGDSSTYNDVTRRLDVSGHPMKDLARQSKNIVGRTQQGLIAEGHKPGTNPFNRLLYKRVNRRMNARADMLEGKIISASSGEVNKRYLEKAASGTTTTSALHDFVRQSDTIIQRTHDGLVAHGYEPGTPKFNNRLQNRINRRMKARAESLEGKM